MDALLAVPLLLPGLVVSAFAAAVLAGRIGRGLRTSPLHGGLLVASLGLIVSVTLTPLNSAFQGEAGTGLCDMSRLGFAPLSDYGDLGEPGQNLVLFVPLGISLGLLPRSSARSRLILAALALPIAIEGTQLTLTVLDRGCESGDVIDNLTGLILGFGAGGIVRLLVSLARDQ